ISDRKLELSSDGFKQDVRAVPVPFVNAGEQRFGGNVNTLFEAKVGQKARQIRLTLTPARPECTVYLAEVELHGVRPGATTPITACATGDLNGDGKAEVVVGSASGGIRALTADGQPLWTFASDDRAAINCLACADVDGDGKAEVMYGTAGRLGLLGSDGKERWRAEPPKFRGLTSDVMTVFPADVNGDRKTEIVCGCASWQYFAYDAQGKMVWKNIIYAHSATVGCAADVDGDGKDEIVAGNVYYRLNLIDHDGKRLWNAGNLGPEMTAVAAADVNGDKRPEILTGVDGGNLHCYDRTGKELWVINLGDKVTRILAVDLNGDGKDEIVCSAESAHVFALNTDGRILWRTALPDGVSDLALVRGKGKALFVAAAGTAGVAVLDGDGKVLAVATTQDRANSVLLSDGRAFATTAKGAVEAFELPLR
ncbi:MAG: hypothetical protein FJ279_32915, partial [Planctomycetes bacterium]|nr:hypothetical protein [Planctomycetota bacterium]